MSGNRVRRRITAGVRATGLVLGLAGIAALAGAFSPSAALAGTGTQPGALSLNPASGALSSTPTWSTADGCPVGYQASAMVAEFYPDGTFASDISPVIPGVGDAFSGALDGNIGALLSFVGITPSTPGTSEWAVRCFSGPSASGSMMYSQSIFVTIGTTGATYTTSASTELGATATTTTLTAAPSPPAAGATVTLSASVTAADGTTPSGTVQFMINDTSLGAPVNINADGVPSTATTSTSFATVGPEQLSAVFTPTSGRYAPSTGAYPVQVGGDGPEPGALSLNPASGPLSSRPTWSTSDGCPVGYQGSAYLVEFRPDGTLASIISPVITGNGLALSGYLQGSVGALLAFVGITPSTPGTSEWAVACRSGRAGSGPEKYVQATFVGCAGPNYTTSASPEPTQACSPPATWSPVPSPGTTTPTGSPPVSVVSPAVATMPTGLPPVSVVSPTVSTGLNSAGTAAPGTAGTITMTHSKLTYPGRSVPGQQSNFAEAASASTTTADQMSLVSQAIGTALAEFLRQHQHMRI